MVRTTLCALVGAVLTSTVQGRGLKDITLFTEAPALTQESSLGTEPTVLSEDLALRTSWLGKQDYRIEGVDENYHVILVDHKQRRTPVRMTSLDLFLLDRGVPKAQRRALLDDFFDRHYDTIVQRRWKKATDNPVWQKIVDATAHFEPARRDFYRTIAILESTGGSDPAPTGGCIGVYQLAAAVLEHMKWGGDGQPGHPDLRKVNHLDLRGTKNIPLQTKVFDYYIRWLEKELGTTIEEDPDKIRVGFNAGPRIFDGFRGRQYRDIKDQVCDPTHIRKIGKRYQVKAYQSKVYPYKKAIIMEAYAEMGRRLTRVFAAFEFMQEQQRLALSKENEEEQRRRVQIQTLLYEKPFTRKTGYTLANAQNKSILND